MNLKHVAGLMLLGALGVVGCGRNPTQPSEPGDSLSNHVRAAELRISRFTIKGWFIRAYSYFPALEVTIPADSRALRITQVEFKTNSGQILGTHGRVGGRLEPSTSFTVTNPDFELRSDVQLPTITAEVLFRDDTGRSYAMTAVAVPELADPPPAGTLVVGPFTVTAYPLRNGLEYYQPAVTLVETSGVTSVTVREMTLELLEVNNPDSTYRIQPLLLVRGGETKTVVDDFYEVDLFEIFSPAKASRVSLAISYHDVYGRAGIVRAVANVTR
jgi:hypothetical protein